MSEVDRLSNSGLYPALPIAEKRSRKDGPPADGTKDRRPTKPPASGSADATPSPMPADPDAPRPPGARIDEYA